MVKRSEMKTTMTMYRGRLILRKMLIISEVAYCASNKVLRHYGVKEAKFDKLSQLPHKTIDEYHSGNLRIIKHMSWNWWLERKQFPPQNFSSLITYTLQMWPSTMKWVIMCQAYFCSSKEFAAGVWKCWFWDFGYNCVRNHLSLVCNMEIAHFSMFHGRKHDF